MTAGSEDARSDDHWLIDYLTRAGRAEGVPPTRPDPAHDEAEAARVGRAVLASAAWCEPVGPAVDGGATADVYEVRVGASDQRLALKVPREDRGWGLAALLADQAHQRALSHRHIVPVVGLGRLGDRFGLLMPFYSRNLAQWVAERGPLAGRALAEAAFQIASGLVHAYGLGVAAHRDVKPANVMVHAGGGAPVFKVGDFGFARAHRPAAGRPRVGRVGTVGWMAPEQIRRAAAVDEKADVFAVGLLMAYLSPGGPQPAAGAHGHAAHVLTPDERRALERAADADPSGREVDAVMGGVVRRAGAAVEDPVLRAVCLRCLALDPARRPPMAELAAALDQWLHYERVPLSGHRYTWAEQLTLVWRQAESAHGPARARQLGLVLAVIAFLGLVFGAAASAAIAAGCDRVAALNTCTLLYATATALGLGWALHRAGRDQRVGGLVLAVAAFPAAWLAHRLSGPYPAGQYWPGIWPLLAATTIIIGALGTPLRRTAFGVGLALAVAGGAGGQFLARVWPGWPTWWPTFVGGGYFVAFSFVALALIRGRPRRAARQPDPPAGPAA